jgi:hypothetical protein
MNSLQPSAFSHQVKPLWIFLMADG